MKASNWTRSPAAGSSALTPAGAYQVERGGAAPGDDEASSGRTRDYFPKGPGEPPMFRHIAVVSAFAVVLGITPVRAAPATIGVNVVLNWEPTATVLAQLGEVGTVLDVIPEINALTMKIDASALDDLEALDCVDYAGLDEEYELASEVSLSDFAGGANVWS